MTEEQWQTTLTYLRCLDAQNRSIIERKNEAVEKLAFVVLRRDVAKIGRLERKTYKLEARIKVLLSKVRSLERLRGKIIKHKATINALRQELRRQKRLPSARLRGRIIELRALNLNKDQQIKELSDFLEK